MSSFFNTISCIQSTQNRIEVRLDKYYMLEFDEVAFALEKKKLCL